jgi:hypothetical protein
MTLIINSEYFGRGSGLMHLAFYIVFQLGNVTDATHAQFFDDIDLSRFHIRVREILIGCWQANPLTRPSLIGLLDMINIALNGK